MIPYRQVLLDVHRQLRPQLYVEIGVRAGHSLALSSCRSYGIDPAFALTVELDADIRLFRQTSDDFYARKDIGKLFSTRGDLGFIDGVHLFEHAYRDFMNMERYSKPNGVVIFDDIFPRNIQEATRVRATTAWTGDVWKMLYALIELRPDLVLIPLDTAPTGMLLVCNLDPDSTALARHYDQALATFNAPAYDRPDADILGRSTALKPQTLLASGLLGKLANLENRASIPALVRSVLPGVLLPGAYTVEPVQPDA